VGIEASKWHRFAAMSPRSNRAVRDHPLTTVPLCRVGGGEGTAPLSRSSNGDPGNQSDRSLMHRVVGSGLEVRQNAANRGARGARPRSTVAHDTMRRPRVGIGT